MDEIKIEPTVLEWFTEIMQRPYENGKVPKSDILFKVLQNTPYQGIWREEIDPISAERLMELNIGNRPVMQLEVREHTDEMIAGKWVFNGDVIRVSWDLKLIDGQHKLLALIASGTTQSFNIQVGLDPAAFNVIDVGRKRKGGDILAVMGIKNYNVTAAAIKAIIYFSELGSVGARVSRKSVTNQQMAEWASRERDMKLLGDCIYNAVNKYHVGSGKFLSQSTYAFLGYIFSKKSKDHADEFLSKLATGELIGKTKFSAIYLLREKLTEIAGKTHTEKGRVIDLKVRYVITAWNSYRYNESLQKLVVTNEFKLPKPV